LSLYSLPPPPARRTKAHRTGNEQSPRHSLSHSHISTR